MKKYILFLISILLISCVTNPPMESENIEATVVINSNIDGAEIFLNDDYTGKLTPDSLVLSQGDYNIRLEKTGYISAQKSVNINSNSKQELYFELEVRTSSKVVVLEDFANVSCVPCVASNIIIKNVADEYKDQLVVVKYSTDFPSPNDPFYLAATSENNSKMNFYNILIAPTIIVDGIEIILEQDENKIVAAIENRFLENSPFELELVEQSTSNQYRMNAQVTLLDENFDYSNCRLFGVIVEEEISFKNPPGSNGETEFFHVMRDILPNEGGTTLNLNNGTMEIDLQSEYKSEWDRNHLSAIVFIQNITTKEIYQANKIEN